ncbi:bifunctional hydroxymethylpyrimidine kinase/phosphomethylpyrimidine kinase [Sporosarcina sp. FSL K6-1522]|uniref:bifunctional hydroxymethylpyrimidine kinase/phosphomethylpyrimidine kinase n=1 Tax=Sporosarcina sp. FSL K6-1522 TaxID=2921554 RepID=UPI003159B88B
MTNVAMTIAGSDSGGGAGIQADLKTFQELGVFGTSALTAVTAQNTLGVHGVYPIDADGVTAQMRAVLDDFNVGAVKTGMLFSAEIIRAVAETLRAYASPTLIIDPVMIAKGGASLLLDEAVEALKTDLIPLATVITPNIPEAEVLAGMPIETDADVVKAAERILQLGAKAVVMKGGHRQQTAFAEDLFLAANGERYTIRSEWIDTKDTHGTGCTFSAALTARIAQGMPIADAVIDAKRFIQAAIADGLDLGAGHGPTNHWAYKRGGEVAQKEGVVID